MTDKSENWTEADEARLVRLMRAVPRAAPEPAARRRAFDAVQAEWRELQRETARRRPALRARWLAAASVAVIALAGVLWLAPFARPVASLDLVHGRVTDAGGPLVAGAMLRAGATLETAADSGALVRYSPDLTLRLDSGTRVTVEDAGTLRLASGRVYVAVAPGTTVAYVVRTDAGDVRHLGTHYSVEAHGAELTVAVREGAVQVGAGAHAERAVAGELLRIDGGKVARSSVAGDDARWSWVEALPAPIVIEGKSLAEFLRWYAAETGRRVTYADDGTRVRAASAILHGSVDGLPPAQALVIVTASVDLEAIVPKEGPVVIGPAQRPAPRPAPAPH